MKKQIENNAGMKIEEGFTFITEAGNLLVVYKKFKNGRMYAYEFTSNGIEEVEHKYDDQVDFNQTN